MGGSESSLFPRDEPAADELHASEMGSPSAFRSSLARIALSEEVVLQEIPEDFNFVLEDHLRDARVMVSDERVSQLRYSLVPSVIDVRLLRTRSGGECDRSFGDTSPGCHRNMASGEVSSMRFPPRARSEHPAAPRRRRTRSRPALPTRRAVARGSRSLIAPGGTQSSRRGARRCTVMTTFLSKHRHGGPDR